MKKLNCYEMAMMTAFAKEIEFILWTHDNTTGDETLKRIIATEMEYQYGTTSQYECVMISATKKYHFKIHGYREIN